MKKGAGVYSLNQVLNRGSLNRVSGILVIVEFEYYILIFQQNFFLCAKKTIFMYVQNRMLHNRNPYTVENLGDPSCIHKIGLPLNLSPIFFALCSFFSKLWLNIGDLENSRLY